jgi:hypothetical protein
MAVRGEKIRLNLWEEIVGKLEGLREDGRTLRVELSSGILEYDSLSDESEVLRRLAGREGALVGILRTDLSPPLAVRIFEEAAEARWELAREGRGGRKGGGGEGEAQRA